SCRLPRSHLIRALHPFPPRRSSDLFAFNVLFWCFFEQAGSSFNFLADGIVDRVIGDWTFPVAWFQSVNSVAILTLAPVIAWIWRSEEHTSELQSREKLVCRLLLAKK